LGGVVAEANIKFLKPAFFDDKLSIDVIPHNPFSKGFTLNYVVRNQREMECLQAEITIIFVDDTGKSIKTPEDIKDKIFDKCI
jgi:acyl-CoA thioesterase FadM